MPQFCPQKCLRTRQRKSQVQHEEIDSISIASFRKTAKFSCESLTLKLYGIYIYTYRTRAIITRGLYTFYRLFEVQKRFFMFFFS